MATLAGKTLFITGGSRGIGKAIAVRAAADGANVVIAAKTAEPHPKLPGTVYSAADAVNEAGGNGLACVVDIRFQDQIVAAIEKTIETFGSLDILVNNASAISLTPTLATTAKRYDLMHDVNTRGTFMCSQAAIPHLKKSGNPHILNLSPPLNMETRWFKNHVAYTMAKFGMSMCVLGMSEELRSDGIAVNALWPRTAIATAAVKNLLGGQDSVDRSRKPTIVADAAHEILTSPAKELTGQFIIDDEILASRGVTDFDQYAVKPGMDLIPDFFI